MELTKEMVKTSIMTTRKYVSISYINDFEYSSYMYIYLVKNKNMRYSIKYRPRWEIFVLTVFITIYL